MKDIINYSEISRILCNNRTSISKTRIPKKHKEKIKELELFIQNWIKSLERQ
jgi:hypothetical protein